MSSTACYVPSFDVVRNIIMPATETGQDPQQYAFAYNSDTVVSATDTIKTGCTTSSSVTRDASPGLGEISEITLPTQATIEYDFRNDGTHKIGFISDKGAQALVGDAVEGKRVLHDGTTDTYTYDVPLGSAPELSSMTDPDGSTYSEKYFPKDFLKSYLSGTDGTGGLVYRTIRSGKIMTEKHWALLGGTMYSFGSSGKKVTFNPVVDTEYTSLLDGSGARVKMSAKKFEYDYNGELTKTTEYDWFSPGSVSFDSATGVPNGVPTGAAVVRVTNNSYYNSAATSSDTTAYHKRTVGTTGTILLGLPKEMTIGDGTTVKSTTRFSYDAQSYGSAPSLGNLTKSSAWDDVGSQWLDSQITYDSYGNVTAKTDPSGNVTNIYYADSTHVMPTSIVVNPNNGTGTQTTSTSYDFYTGLPLISTDVNGNVSSVSYTNNLLGAVDPFGRPGTTYSPYVTIDGISKRQTVKTYYEDSNLKTRTESDLFNEGDGLIKTRKTINQLGRNILTERNENGAVNYTISSETVYDTANRVTFNSNPRRGAAALIDGWTRTTRDDLGRVIETASFSGSTLPYPTGTADNWTGSVTTSYSYNATTVADQAGKLRRSITNALGQLIEIDEPNSSGQLDTSGAAAQPTYYSYDTIGNLTQVTQGSQNRYFYYSSLARLKEANNPESGTIKYTYDLNGNLKTKLDARGIKIVNDYDGFSRIVKRCYRIVGTGSLGMTTCTGNTETAEPNTPDVTYTYENGSISNSKGKLTKVDNGFSKTEYPEFDVLGRIKKSKQTTDGIAYNEMTYTYDLSGALSEETYPSGRKVKNTFDNGGNLSQVLSTKNSSAGYWAYANSFTYNAANAVTSLQLGNGHWESTAFNGRLQPTLIALGTTPNATDLLNFEYAYGQWESGALIAAKNNGNVAQQMITVPTVGSYSGFVATQKYEYDQLNRITNATETISNSQTWRQAFTYDRYGNRNFDEANTTTLTKACGTSPNFTVCTADRKKENPSLSTSSNRIDQDQDGDNINEFTFDSAGNTTRDATTHQYVFDGENKMVQAKDSSNNPLGTYFYDGDGKRVKKIVPNGETTIFVYDASGKIVAEYSTVLASTPEVSYLTNDPLGSARINTNASGGVKARHDYHPFGEEISTAQRTTGNGYDLDGIRKKFTGYERDNETGLDFAQARMYSNQIGRFTMADPIYIKLDRLIDPQQLNRYIYVRNSPLKYTDIDGRDLSLPPGLKKVDQDRIIKNLVNIYRKEGGRAAINQLEKSDMNYVIKSGKLPTKPDLMNGGYRDEYGLTKEATPLKGTKDANGKIDSITTPRNQITIEITVDFNKRDSAQNNYENTRMGKEPLSERDVVAHEIAHGQDKDNDLVKELNKTDPQAEKTAKDFVKTISEQKNSMSEEDAESAVREILNTPKEKKKDN